ncbi:hypothetical protein AK51_13535 [Serratia nematodiphila DZ0503SBS1]|nr:hypothetical protein AK51_13535 [Serratia nematodiphila DZ0503SBS1]
MFRRNVSAHLIFQRRLGDTQHQALAVKLKLRRGLWDRGQIRAAIGAGQTGKQLNFHPKPFQIFPRQTRL